MISCLRNSAALIAIAAAAHAQNGALGGDFSVPPTPAPVGAGARAAGMGNAFVAVADDATAASWNPAGLVQLERPELSIVGSWRQVLDRFDSDLQPEAAGDHHFGKADLNYFSVAYPLPVTVFGRNVVLSLNYQRRFDFTRDFEADTAARAFLEGPPPLTLRQRGTLRFDQEGQLSTISPALAFEITNRISVGLAVNVWRSLLDENGWEQTTRFDTRTWLGGGLSLGRGYAHERYAGFRGVNATVGALWNVTDRWNLGLRYDSAFTGTADYESLDRQTAFPAGGRPTSNRARTREQREIRFPATVALGAAWRASDRLTLAADVSRTDWNKAWIRDGRGTKFSLVDGTDLDAPRTRTQYNAVWTARLGGEYTFIPKDPGETLRYLWSVRGGLSYEGEPASGRSTRRAPSRGDGHADHFYGASVGVGLLAWQRVNFDAAYALRYGPGVNADLLRGVEGFDADEWRHDLRLSATVYLDRRRARNGTAGPAVE